MSSMFDLVHAGALAQTSAEQLAKLNEFSKPYGLALTAEEAHDLEVQHRELLVDHDRVEFGTSAVEQLVVGFASSPYIQSDEYAEDLADLQETFYELRSQAGVDIFDDEIIDGMRLLWDGDAAGTIELLNACTLDMVMEAYNTQTGSLAERQREIIPDGDQHTEVPVFEDNISEVFPAQVDAPTTMDQFVPQWNEDEWHDDITAPGFEGEKWDEHYDD